jgi:hypothetical protein
VVGILVYQAILFYKISERLEKMTTITYNSRAQRPTSVLASLGQTLVAFYEGVQDGLAMADRYHTLSRMSDEQLAKQGLARSSVARAVVLGHGRI